jgi:GNAT superfamily N-acetyltransferase
MRELAAFDPIKISTWACAEKTPQTPPYLEKRGWRRGMKIWDSKLDLTSWDPAPFLGAVERAEKQGIGLTSLAALRDRDPDFARKVYEMEREIWQDIPLPDKQTDPGFDWYRRHVIEAPNLYPEAFWLGMDGDRPVGLSCLWKQKSGNHLGTGLTGTLRAYRKRGLATALKVKALSFAKAKGHPWVKTDNEENNVGMVGINKRLGFVDYPSWQGFELILGPEEP